MTPFFKGWVATMWAGVRPIMLLAAEPTATTLSVFMSMATTEGSESTTPQPLTNTNVFAVPKSMATSGANNRLNIPIFATWFPTLHLRKGLADPRKPLYHQWENESGPGGAVTYRSSQNSLLEQCDRGSASACCRDRHCVGERRQ